MSEMLLFGTPRMRAYDKAQAKAPSVRNEIVKLLTTYGEATLDDFCRWLGKQPHQCSGRLTELTKSGTIRVTGVRNVDGRALSVYRLSL